MDALRLERPIASDQFAAEVAGPIGDLIAIHPFRDDNGRTIRALIGILAQRIDLAFDQTRLDPDAWNRASSGSFRAADPEPLRAVIAGAICVR